MGGWLIGLGGALLLAAGGLMYAGRRQGTSPRHDLKLFGAWTAAVTALLLIAGGLRLLTIPPPAETAFAPPLTSTAAPTDAPTFTAIPVESNTPAPTPTITLTPTPTPVPAQSLFVGVGYSRDVRSEPVPLVIHVVAVDLTGPGIGFLVTPGQPVAGNELVARTTSEFLQDFGLQVAINGDFFGPWHYTNPTDYYPHSGDPVDAYGLAASAGTIYSTGEEHPNEVTLYLSEDNRASFGKPIGPVYNAISGGPLLVDGGRALQDIRPNDSQNPRTAVGLNEDGQTLLLIVVDGRQAGISLGVTLDDLGKIAAQYGAYTAMNLDGGGSSALVIGGRNGSVIQLNTPIHAFVRGTERPVANHLGVYARAIDE